MVLRYPESELRMKVGVYVPVTGPLPGQVGVVRMGRLAEEAGADSLWVNDHIFMVEGARSTYPFSQDGVPPWSMDTPWYECLTAASFLAATTSSCRIGTAVLILPQRNVLELAKTTATLDALSNGRLTLGVGAGWFAEEIEALDYSFEARGQRMDEMIEVLRSCWSGRPQPFEGNEIFVPEGLIFEPRPMQLGGPPILVGGMSRAALRRAATVGDGWLAFQRDELDVVELEESLKTLRELRKEASLLDEPLTNVVRLRSSPDLQSRLPELATQAAELGFNELIIDLPWNDPNAAKELLETVKAAV